MGWKNEMSCELRASSFEYYRAGSSRPRSSFPSAPRHSQLANRGFTLTELLVVITIIAILASLITAGAVNALNAAKRGRISLEINQLGQSMEEFKNRYNAYPPNGMNDGTNVLAINDFVRAFRKAFPRHQEHENLIRALAGANLTSATGEPSLLDGGMTSAEAIYFWLGGFSEDPLFPLSGPGGPAFDPSTTAGEVLESRNRIYEFDLGRLGPRNDAGVFNATDLPNPGPGRFITYVNPLSTGGPRLRINLWTYNPSGSQQPYIYFDASRHDPVDYDLNLAGTDVQLNRNANSSLKSDYLNSDLEFIFGIKKVREGKANAVNPQDIVYVNKGKFQILHCGLDDAWGAEMPASATDRKGFWAFNTDQFGVNVNVFPTGPFTGDIADTLTNFTPGTLESAQE